MLELIKPGTKINFMGRKWLGFLFSGIVMLVGIVSLILHGGPIYGIDFAGGTVAQVKFSQPVESDAIRGALKDAGLETSSVQQFEGEGKGEYLIRLEKIPADLASLSATISTALAKQFGEKAFEVRRIEIVGPKVGKELRNKGIVATIFALIAMLIYISWRFEFRFAVGGVVALAHDVIVTIGILSLTNTEFSIPILAALLTIVGYSINDTIVVYDRIRENLPKMRKEPLEKVINISVNETLSRTILTSFTVFIVLLALYFLGGGVIHDFSFALIIGVVFGTYSSVFIASALVAVWENKFPKKKR
jgi:preprotein translocase subunit SecF